MAEPDISRDLGRHDEAIDTIKSELHELRCDVHEIKGMISETRGGIRILVAVGSVSGAVGAFITKYFMDRT